MVRCPRIEDQTNAIAFSGVLVVVRVTCSIDFFYWRYCDAGMDHVCVSVGRSQLVLFLAKDTWNY